MLNTARPNLILKSDFGAQQLRLPVTEDLLAFHVIVSKSIAHTRTKQNESKSNLKRIFEWSYFIGATSNCHITRIWNLWMVGVGPHHWRPPGHPPWQPVVNLTPTSKEFIPAENKDSKLRAHGKNFANLAFSNLHLVSSNLCWPRSLNPKHNLFPRIVNKNKEFYFIERDNSKMPDLDNNLAKAEFSGPILASTIPCWQAHSDAKYNLLFQIFAENIICPQQSNYWWPIQTICKKERKTHQTASFFCLKLWSQQQTWQSNWSIYWFSILQVLVRQPGTNFPRRL